MKHTYAILCLLFLSILGHGQSYFLNGDAIATGEDCYRLTTTLQNQNGTVWYGDQIDLNFPFNIQFRMNLGNNDGGADGICFVIQTVGTSAIGASGGGMGYLNFGTSLGIEFDTYQNGDYNDPGFDHIAIQRNGDINHNSPTGNLAGPVQMSPFNQNTEDGQEHVVQIVWEPVGKTVSVYFDCYFRTQAQIDLQQEIFNGNNLVYWGFTAATGGLFNDQTVCLEENILDVNDAVTVCPGLSTPLYAGASLDGAYTWAPATYLDNANAASPICTPQEDISYTVTFTNLCGDNVTANIDVNVEDLALEATADQDITCVINTSQLAVSSNFGAQTNYAWGTVGGNIAGSTTNSSIQATTVGTYQVIGNIENTCIDTLLFQVTDNSVLPQISLGGDQVLNCYNEGTVALQPSSTASNPSFVWRRNGSTINGATQNIYNATTAGTYVVLVTDGLTQCTGSDTLNLTSNFDAPVLELGPQDSLSCLQPVVQIDPLNFSADREYTVSWQGPFPVSPTTLLTAQISQPGLYTATLTYTENGCSTSSDVLIGTGLNVNFKPEGMVYPNIITPNSDGVNQFWKPYFILAPEVELGELFSKWNLQVFNRWGAKVFETESASKLFDGKDLSDGVYFYTLEYKTACGGGVEKSVNGTITIAR